MKATSRKTRPVASRLDSVPDPVDDLEQTREMPALSGEGDKAGANPPGAAPQNVIPAEETVPVQSCIESTLLQEVLRRQSEEEDEPGKDS